MLCELVGTHPSGGCAASKVCWPSFCWLHKIKNVLSGRCRHVVAGSQSFAKTRPDVYLPCSHVPPCIATLLPCGSSVVSRSSPYGAVIPRLWRSKVFVSGGRVR